MNNNNVRYRAMFMVLIANVLVAFGTLKTLEMRLLSESQKAYSNAPLTEEKQAYVQPSSYRFPMGDYGGAHLNVIALTTNGPLILSE